VCGEGSLRQESVSDMREVGILVASSDPNARFLCQFRDRERGLARDLHRRL
jgi:hypothetical protein